MAEESHAQNRTRFLHREAYWPGLELTYNDVYYRRGGLRVVVFGTGHTAVQVVDDRDQEARYGGEARIRTNPAMTILVPRSLADSVKPYVAQTKVLWL